MRLGIAAQLKHSSPYEWARLHREAGLGAVVFPLEWNDRVSVIDAYVNAAKENDLVIAEVGAWSNPMDPDPKKRKESREYCLRQLELAEYVGAKCCLNLSGAAGERRNGAYKENYAPETFDEIVFYLQEMLDRVKPVRTHYALEAMPHLLPDTPESYMELIKAVDRPGFGVHIDIVNMLTSPRVYFENRKLIRDTFDLLGPRVLSCHVKDAVLDHGLTVSIRETECGMGGLDLKYYIEQAEKHDPEMPMIIEHLDEIDQYFKAIEYIKGLKSGRVVLK